MHFSLYISDYAFHTLQFTIFTLFTLFTQFTQFTIHFIHSIQSQKMFATHLAPILFKMHCANLGDIHREILSGMGILEFQWGIGIPMGSIIVEAIRFPLPHGISQGVGFPIGYGNPMGYCIDFSTIMSRRRS